MFVVGAREVVIKCAHARSDSVDAPSYNARDTTGRQSNIGWNVSITGTKTKGLL